MRSLARLIAASATGVTTENITNALRIVAVLHACCWVARTIATVNPATTSAIGGASDAR